MKPNTYTIQTRTKEGDWKDWRFCRAAEVASWKHREPAERYAEKLRKLNPEKEYRIIFWTDIFTITKM